MTTTEKNNLLERLENAESLYINYYYEEAFNRLRDLADDLDKTELFDDFITQDTAEGIARQELEVGGLSRLYYFMGNVNFGACGDWLKINGYGNLEEIDRDDLEYLADELRDTIESL